MPELAKPRSKFKAEAKPEVEWAQTSLRVEKHVLDFIKELSETVGRSPNEIMCLMLKWACSGQQGWKEGPK